MTAVHLTKADLLAKRYGLARRKGVTSDQAYAEFDRWVAANPPLRHLLLGGSVACGAPLTSEQFAIATVRTLDAVTCRRCHAAVAARATAAVTS